MTVSSKIVQIEKVPEHYDMFMVLLGIVTSQLIKYDHKA